MQNKRDQNIDHLKVISILMIIAFHYVYHGHLGLNSQSFFVSFISKLVYHFGELGTSCFILASGYYLEETIFKPKKIILYVLEIEFYIILSKAVLIVIGVNTSWDLYCFFPFFRNEYWFIHVYLLIYFLTPFLRKIIISPHLHCVGTERLI